MRRANMGESARAVGPEPAKLDDPAPTRERILRAAAHLFRTRGYRGTTTRAISEIVGILSGSLFHYFKSKQQMLFEVMHEGALSVCLRADEVVAAAATPRERLRALIRMHLDCLLSENTKDFYAVLIFEWRELDVDAKPLLTQLRRRYNAVWYEVLEQCQRQGLLRGEPRATHLALNGALSWAATWFKPSGMLTPEQYAETLDNMVLEQSSTYTDR
jgi:TetR/AcrR family transcriptional regulator, cholesterol catabolism regulator